ncbi:MAG: hypothetical protein N3B21_16935 [Clostridia bacterium]|nr:hypothetical protein [Clostridia bacterium]
MDVFIEKIIKRKKRLEDYIYIFTISIVGLILITYFLPIRFLNLPLAMGITYGAYLLIRKKNIEFEYAVTSGELDIDKIIAKRKRTRIFSASCKEFDIIARLKSDKYTQEFKEIKNRITAVSSPNSPDIYFAALNYKGQKTVLFFEPSIKMLEAFKAYIPRKVFIE